MIFIEPFYLATHIKYYYSLLLNIFLRTFYFIHKKTKTRWFCYCPALQNKTIEKNRIKVDVYNVNLPHPYILDTLVLPEVCNNIADLEEVFSGGSQPSFPHSPSVSAAHAHKPFPEIFTYAFWFAQWTCTKSLEILCPVTSHQANSNLAGIPGSSWWESCFWQELPPWWRTCFRPWLPSL